MRRLGKKGLSTIEMFPVFFYIMIGIVMLGIFVFIYNTATTNIGVDIDVGAVNLKNITDSTMGQVNLGLLDQADNIGLGLIFGLLIGIFINGFFMSGKYPKLMVIVDIIILITVYIFAVYLSNSYETLIQASTTLDVYTEVLPLSSKFVLYLPRIVGVVGAIAIIISTVDLPKNSNEEVMVQ